MSEAPDPRHGRERPARPRALPAPRRGESAARGARARALGARGRGGARAARSTRGPGRDRRLRRRRLDRARRRPAATPRSTSSASSRRRARTAMSTRTSARARRSRPPPTAAGCAGSPRSRSSAPTSTRATPASPRARAPTRSCCGAKTPAVVIRVPMVLGAGDPASRRARAPGARTARAARARRRLARPADRRARRGGRARRGARPARARRRGARARRPRIALAPRARRARGRAARHPGARSGAVPVALAHAVGVARRARERRPADHARDARRGRARRRDRPRARARAARYRSSLRSTLRCARRCWGTRDDRRRTPDAARAPAPPLWQRALPWIVTLVCFAWLGYRIAGAAARQGKSAFDYLMEVFASVPWHLWLALMIPYSAFFFLVDSTVVWRVVNWFNARVPWTADPADPRQRVHHLDPERAGRQGRDGALPEPAPRRAGLGSRLVDAVHHGLRAALPDVLGAASATRSRATSCRTQFRLVPWIALGVFAAFVGVGRLLPRLDRAGLRAARAPDPARRSARRARCAMRRSPRCARPRCSRR